MKLKSTDFIGWVKCFSAREHLIADEKNPCLAAAIGLNELGEVTSLAFYEPDKGTQYFVEVRNDAGNEA